MLVVQKNLIETPFFKQLRIIRLYPVLCLLKTLISLLWQFSMFWTNLAKTRISLDGFVTIRSWSVFRPQNVYWNCLKGILKFWTRNGLPWIIRTNKINGCRKIQRFSKWQAHGYYFLESNDKFCSVLWDFGTCLPWKNWIIFQHDSLQIRLKWRKSDCKFLNIHHTTWVIFICFDLYDIGYLTKSSIMKLIQKTLLSTFSTQRIRNFIPWNWFFANQVVWSN